MLSAHNIAGAYIGPLPTRSPTLRALTKGVDGVSGLAVPFPQGVSLPPAWDGRTSAAYHTQPDGSLVKVLPGELRVEGARRVCNVLNSDDPNTWTGYWGGLDTVESGISDPVGGNDAYRVGVKARAGKLTGFIAHTANIAFSSDSPDPVTCVIAMRSDAPLSLRISGGNISRNKLVAVATQWRYFAIEGYSNAAITNRGLIVTSQSVNQSYMVDVYAAFATHGHGAIEVGHLADVDYGFGVPGVRYLPHENGNTVDADGVVTEAAGPPLQGSFPLLLEPERTNAFTSALDFSAISIAGGGSFEAYPSVNSPAGSSEGVYRISGNSSSYLARSGVTNSGFTKAIWARTVSGAGSLALINYHGSGNVFSLNEDWQLIAIEDDDYAGPGKGNFYLADFRGGDLSEALVWLPQSISGGGALTSPCEGTRTADGALHFPGVPPNAHPFVDHVADDGQRKTVTGLENELCTYDSITETLSVGHDTSATRRIVSVRYDS